MNDLPLIEPLADLYAALPVFLVRVGIAAACGWIIGVERERHHKPAGFRTNILICAGAAMYMVVGQLIASKSASGVDPTRIAAQVVTGIGFLGAGNIIQSGGRVTGLTSAATIWVVAAIGIVSGAGFPILALIASVMVIATLTLLWPVEKRWIDRGRDHAQDAED